MVIPYINIEVAVSPLHPKYYVNIHNVRSDNYYLDKLLILPNPNGNQSCGQRAPRFSGIPLICLILLLNIVNSFVSGKSTFNKPNTVFKLEIVVYKDCSFYFIEHYYKNCKTISTVGYLICCYYLCTKNNTHFLTLLAIYSLLPFAYESQATLTNSAAPLN